METACQSMDVTQIGLDMGAHSLVALLMWTVGKNVDASVIIPGGVLPGPGIIPSINVPLQMVGKRVTPVKCFQQQ